MAIHILVEDSAAWERREFSGDRGVRIGFSKDVKLVDPTAGREVGALRMTIYRGPSDPAPATPPLGIYFLPESFLSAMQGGLRVDWDRFCDQAALGSLLSTELEYVAGDGVAFGHIRRIGGRAGAPRPDGLGGDPGKGGKVKP